jgi:hypothetical protein
MLLVRLGEALGLCDLFEVPWCFTFVAAGANGCEPIEIIDVVTCGPQRDRGSVVEDDLAEGEPGAAIGAPAVLAEQDLGPDPARDHQSLGREKRAIASHRFTSEI